ncbi:helicase, RecD/TraA family [Clostridiales bacterium oral taxon 876 str. F0540]|nr:helicase, RecD/TraA family [Clostridiales bacterium oral taxon 876 str. F0540]
MIDNCLKFKVKKIIDVGFIQAEVIEHSYQGNIKKNISISGDLGDIKEFCTYEALIKEYTISRISCTCKLDGRPELVDIDNTVIADILKYRVKVLSKIKAEKIVNVLGKDTMELLKADYKCLLKVPGIGENLARKVYESIIVFDELYNMLLDVKAIDTKEEIISNVIDKLGLRAVEIIKDNPYVINQEVGIDFKVADSIAINQDMKFDDINRVKALILSYIDNEIEQNGDLYTLKEKLKLELPEYVDKIGLYKEQFKNVSIETIEKTLKSLVIDNKIVVEDNLKGSTCIYRADYHIIEETIVSKVKELLNNNNKAKNRYKNEEIRKLIVMSRENDHKLIERQEEAIIMALTNKISIICGNAGSGKSYVIGKLIDVLKELNPNATVELASPTGKAAIKLKDVSDKEAMTVHRLFNISVGDNHRNKINKIQADYLVIDEGSMLDTKLFHHIITNISDNTNLIIVGDDEQLRSVSAGSILCDLIKSGKIPVTNLIDVVRQNEDSLILANANRIIEKKFGAISFDDREFRFIECDSNKILRNIINTINVLKSEGNNTGDIIVLSPLKLGLLGTENLNMQIRNSLQTNKNKAINRFYIRDSVMQTVNNYKLYVMNGEIGQVVKIKTEDEESKYTVKFGEWKVEYDYSNVDELELAFTITIHKSQGSEFPIVIIPVNESNMIYANRNMMYTAITRSKSRVILIGDKKLFFDTISKEEKSRNSRIIEKLNIVK